MGDGIAAISAATRAAASRSEASPSSRSTAARTADAVCSPGPRTRTAPDRRPPSALRNWSAACGRQSCGRPRARAPRKVPEPPCETTAEQPSSTAAWSTHRSTRTWSGCVPEQGRVDVRARPQRAPGPGARPPRSTTSREQLRVLLDRAQRDVDERLVRWPQLPHRDRAQRPDLRDVVHRRALHRGRADVEVAGAEAPGVRRDLEPVLTPQPRQPPPGVVEDRRRHRRAEGVRDAGDVQGRGDERGGQLRVLVDEQVGAPLAGERQQVGHHRRGQGLAEHPREDERRALRPRDGLGRAEDRTPEGRLLGAVRACSRRRRSRPRSPAASPARRWPTGRRARRPGMRRPAGAWG